MSYAGRIEMYLYTNLNTYVLTHTHTHLRTHTHTIIIIHSFTVRTYIGLNIVYTIVKSVLNYPEVSQGFFQLYFMPIVEEIFAVVSEASHTSSEYSSTATYVTHTFKDVEVKKLYYSEYSLICNRFIRQTF